MALAASQKRKAQLIVRPGYGAKELHLRQTECQVRELLGTPESIIRKFAGQYFLNFLSKGIQVDIGKKGGRAKHIYFFRKDVNGYSEAPVVTLDGLRVADTRSKVLRLKGKPHRSGKPLVLNWGKYVGEWWFYNDGINFTFGRDHRVDMISILPSRRTRPTRETRGRRLGDMSNEVGPVKRDPA